MLNLLITRHGQAVSGDIMLGGQLDLSLTEKGRAEAGALAKRLAGVRLDRIVASPMIRALETAQIVATGRPVEVDERLRELDYGQWESLNYAEIEARDPVLRARWDADPAGTHSPGGECGNDVAARVESFLADLLAAELGATATSAPTAATSTTAATPAGATKRRSPDPGGSRQPVTEAQAEAEGERRVLLVTHGTLNRILLCVALGLPVSDYRRRFIQDRANLTVLRYERGDGPDGAQLILANDLAHLRAPGVAPWS
jgi:broad specificity phosphatase PhoE